jgi:hypothetical protein
LHYIINFILFNGKFPPPPTGRQVRGNDKEEGENDRTYAMKKKMSFRTCLPAGRLDAESSLLGQANEYTANLQALRVI